MHGRAVGIIRRRLLGLDMMILADADAHTLVREASREECRLGHAREGPAGIGGEGVGEGSHDVDGLAFNELKECQAQAEVALRSHGHVTKDEEAAVGVVDVLEAVEG